MGIWKKMRFISISCVLALLFGMLPLSAPTAINAADGERRTTGEVLLPYTDVREQDYFAEALLFFTLTDLLTLPEITCFTLVKP